MKLTAREIATFGILGSMMYASKLALEFLPNIHILAPFIVSMTVVYRKKALFPIYIYVFLLGLFSGFAPWWIPNLYIWTVLWGMAMLIPKSTSEKALPFLYTFICALHGLLYGTIYAPAQALLFGLSFKGMIAWIIAGLWFDIMHAIGNTCASFLILPMISVLRFCDKNKK